MEENIYIEDFSTRLANLREQKKISARDMSLAIGLSHNSVNNIERGKNFPTMLNFFYICEHLGVSPSDFFDYDTENPTLISEIITELEKMKTNELEHILGIVKSLNGCP